MDNKQNKMYRGTSSSSCISSISTTSTARVSSLNTSTISKSADKVNYVNQNFTNNSNSSVRTGNVTPTSQDTIPTIPTLDIPSGQSTYSESECQSKKSNMSLSSIVAPSTSTFLSDNAFEGSDDDKSLIEMGFEPTRIRNWNDMAQPRKTNLCKILKIMISRNIKPNVQIHIDTKKFNCHMMVLQCYSNFFTEFKNEVIIKLPKEHVTPRAFIMLYDWMLSEKPLLQLDGIVELFSAATFLRVNELINQSWICFDSEQFSEDTAFLVYLEARKYGLESLQQFMHRRVRKFFLTVVASKDFLLLTAKEITLLLNSNVIGVNTEIEVFMSVVRWLNYDWKNRERDILDIVKVVRFNLIPPWFLVSLTNTDCIEINRVVSHPDIKKMINNGLLYATTQLYYGRYRERFVQLLEHHQLSIPVQRQWIFDKQCAYHHHLKCPNFKVITYRSFLEYLQQIQSSGKNYWRSLEVSNGEQCCSALQN